MLHVFILNYVKNKICIYVSCTVKCIVIYLQKKKKMIYTLN